MTTTRARFKRFPLRLLMVAGLLLAAAPVLAQSLDEATTEGGMWVEAWVVTCPDGTVTIDPSSVTVLDSASSLVVSDPSLSGELDGEKADGSGECSSTLVVIEVSDGTSVGQVLGIPIWPAKSLEATLDPSIY